MTVTGILAVTLPFYQILGVMIFMHAVWGFHSVMYDASKYQCAIHYTMEPSVVEIIFK